MLLAFTAACCEGVCGCETPGRVRGVGHIELVRCREGIIVYVVPADCVNGCAENEGAKVAAARKGLAESAPRGAFNIVGIDLGDEHLLPRIVASLDGAVEQPPAADQHDVAADGDGSVAVAGRRRGGEDGGLSSRGVERLESGSDGGAGAVDILEPV